MLTVGGLMIGAGLVLASCAESLLMLSVVYGLCFGFGVGLTYVSTLGTAMKLFPDRKGLAGGLVTMSYGLSSMCVPIAASNLIEHFGITFALLIFGLVCGSVIAAAGILSGAATSAGVSHEITQALAAFWDRPLAASHSTLPVEDKNWKEMLASPVFYAMLVLFICGSTGALMLIPSAVMISMQQIGLTAQAAAGCVSALAVANTLGRVSGGLISDRIGRLPTLGVSLFAAMSGLMLLLCSGTDDVTTFLAGLILTTVCYGSFVGVFPSLTVETSASNTTVSITASWPQASRQPAFSAPCFSSSSPAHSDFRRLYSRGNRLPCRPRIPLDLPSVEDWRRSLCCRTNPTEA